MESVLENEMVTGATSSEVDTITIELHNPTYPYAIVESKTAILMTDGTASASFNGQRAGHSYWIGIKHRNAVQTWTSAPVGLATTTNVIFHPATAYNFTTAKSKAYGNNMKDVFSEGIWSFYNGDINQDYNIDLIDFPELDNGINNGDWGYKTPDLNGDGNVDLLDFPIFDRNMRAGIYSMFPH